MAVVKENLRCIAVLGWRDSPTDAVEEYCEYLGSELPFHGFSFEITRIRWPEIGWPAALRELDEFSKTARGAWFLVQYTALTWSRRGFPLNVLKVIRRLKANGGNCAVVFHDSEPYPGHRLVDRIRRRVQIYTMRKIMKLADLAIFNVPPMQNPLVPPATRNACFIPVGANLPSPEKAWSKEKLPGQPPTIGVFSLSDGAAGAEEVRLIADALRYAVAQTSPLRLTILGRNSDTSGKQVRELLAGTPVQVDILGLLKPEEVVQVLGSCDVLLFARGPVSTRRGSAIAGIACGLPVVGRAGWETGPPLTEAGLALVPDGDHGLFGPTLLRVLSDRAYRVELAERSRQAQERYFSWKAIATQYAEALGKSAGNGP
ncbi:MAG TPA: glycosyltransferase [Candidatus Saccharimonadales bacterium]|nr:glycosyltransferase [Candidatus Saccharimonadales bacterium]